MKPIWDNNDYKGYSKTMPVARWIDAILEPGKEINYNGSKVILPDTKMLVVSGCNPWHHHQNRNRMKTAFQKLQTVVTIDFAWTATCRFSDIVLPACTQYERDDIDLYGAYSGTGILAMHKLVDPMYQSRTDFAIFTDFCRRFNRSKEFTRGMDERQWIRSLYDAVRKPTKRKRKCQILMPSGPMRKAGLILGRVRITPVTPNSAKIRKLIR
ncbi:trimethylamine-N-oxide reductase [Photobacterium aphoticum]|uniref:Trimethylamine-N-oxide reductase n=1 Tax=Photobacterium aphoticum TaxID=754436 RepID=A0A090QTK2_9GAMM|nr:trimethylamine-N-oxide reductase [Photobacterium aphoticum]